MAKDDALAVYVRSLVKRLRAQQRTTIIAGEQTVGVVVFAAESIDKVAETLARLAHCDDAKPRRRK